MHNLVTLKVLATYGVCLNRVHLFSLSEKGLLKKTLYFVQYAQSYQSQETYDDGYSRRDPYAEESYQEPVAAAG